MISISRISTHQPYWFCDAKTRRILQRYIHGCHGQWAWDCWSAADNVSQFNDDTQHATSLTSLINNLCLPGVPTSSPLKNLLFFQELQRYRHIIWYISYIITRKAGKFHYIIYRLAAVSPGRLTAVTSSMTASTIQDSANTVNVNSFWVDKTAQSPFNSCMYSVKLFLTLGTALLTGSVAKIVQYLLRCDLNSETAFGFGWR